MFTTMAATRPRMIIDTSEDIRLAVKLAAGKEDVSISELINRILRKELANEIKIAREYSPKKAK